MIWARDDLGPVAEDDAGHDLRQLVFALQPAPGFRRRHHQLEHHQLGGRGRERPFGPHGSMPHRGEHALDRVRAAQVVRDCQEYRVRAAIVDPKEVPDGTTQSTPHP